MLWVPLEMWPQFFLLSSLHHLCINFFFEISCAVLTDSATSQLRDHKHHKTDLSDTFSYHATKPSKVHRHTHKKKEKKKR